MLYIYRCGVCRTSSSAGSHGNAESERDRHRHEVHHGHIPDGEIIEPVATPDGAPANLWPLALVLGGGFIAAFLRWIHHFL